MNLEQKLEELIRLEKIHQVILAYSDLSHVTVMHLGSRALACGAGRSGRQSARALGDVVERFHALHEELHTYASRDQEPVLRARLQQLLCDFRWGRMDEIFLTPAGAARRLVQQVGNARLLTVTPETAELWDSPNKAVVFTADDACTLHRTAVGAGSAGLRMREPGG